MIDDIRWAESAGRHPVALTRQALSAHAITDGRTILADLGAEVTKIEPSGGEISRQVDDAYFTRLNRNKHSVCLGLATTGGQLRLAGQAGQSHALLVNWLRRACGFCQEF